MTALVLGNYLRIRRRPIDQNPLSQKNLRMMATWIQDCRDNHFTCSPLGNSSIPSRPTRLVYVGDRRNGVVPRLVLSALLPKDGKYAALSYCWGPTLSMRLITTLATLTARLEGIPWKEIPYAFVDAFLVARMLGLDYIWIDALCIVQDDSVDWQTEASRMGDTYRRAQITFVAAASTSTNESFLSKPPAPKSVDISYRSNIHKSISGNYFLISSEQGYKEDFSRDIEHSVWNERGWTFQEQQ